MKKPAFLLFFPLAAALTLSSCQEAVPEEVPELVEPAHESVQSISLERKDLKKETVYSGSLTPEYTALCYEKGGTICDFYVYSGEEVSEGTPLVRLSAGDTEEKTEELKEQLSYQKKLGEYLQKEQELNCLYALTDYNETVEECGADSSAAGTKRLALEEAQLEQQRVLREQEEKITLMEEEIAEMEEELAEAILTAPCSGIVYYASSLTRGSFVSDEEEFLYLFDNDRYVLTIDEYISAENAEKHEIYAWIRGARYEVELIPASADEERRMLLSGETRRSRFRVISGPETENLETGDSCLLYDVGWELENVLSVPDTALFYDKGGRYVYVMNGEQKEKRYVETGSGNSVETEIREGLEEGEKVYVPD